MKLRLIDRIFIALSGLMLAVLAVWIALDALGAVMPLSEVLAWMLNVNSVQKGLFAAGVCVVLALLGGYDIAMLFRRKKGKRGFVSQKSENGEISIAIKSIEGLVFKCAQKHGEIQVQSVAVEEMRDGLLIKLRASLASGMNIPLAVGTLQKQVKQYITACSGIDVREVQVKVESTDKAADGSPYAVSEAAVTPYVEEPEPVPIPAEAVTPVALPEEEPEIETAEPEERPTHQRLFSPVEEPAIVPAPPVEEPVAEEAAAPVEEIRDEVEDLVADQAEEIQAEAKSPVADQAEEIQAEVESFGADQAEESQDEGEGLAADQTEEIPEEIEAYIADREEEIPSEVESPTDEEPEASGEDEEKTEE